MALELQLEIIEADDRLSFTLEDKTGVFNASTNTTGWGAPNEEFADAEAATLEVWLPKATAATATIDVFPTLPQTDGSTFTINNTDLGLGAAVELPDGVYKMIYKVTRTTATAFSFEVQCWIAFFKKSCKFKDILIAGVGILECKCGGESGNSLAINEVNNIIVKYQGFRDASKCGKKDKAQALVDDLDAYFDCQFDDYVKN